MIRATDLLLYHSLAVTSIKNLAEETCPNKTDKKSGMIVYANSIRDISMEIGAVICGPCLLAAYYS